MTNRQAAIFKQKMDKANIVHIKQIDNETALAYHKNLLCYKIRCKFSLSGSGKVTINEEDLKMLSEISPQLVNLGSLLGVLQPCYS